MPSISVRILDVKNGQVRAQIRVGTQANPATALAEFAEEIRRLFGDNPQPGHEVRCKETANPTPASVRPAPGAEIERARERAPATSGRPRRPDPPVLATNRPQGHRQGHRPPGRPANQPNQPNQPRTCTLAGISGEEVHFDPEQTDNQGRPLKVDALKATDRLLVARPGATFKQRSMGLDGYAQSVVGMGLKKEPDIDRNPYNFVPWVGKRPTEAQEPAQATHDKISDDRLSGRMTVTFTARTPIFVPEGQLQKSDSQHREQTASDTLDFFRCWNGTCDRYAIPGASVKGVVRSLFEALTNSRAGVTDDDALKRPPLYRRRATRLFRVDSMPGASGNGRVTECEYVWFGRGGRNRTSNAYNPDERNQTCKENWRANLFWVEGHRHGSTLRYYPTNRSFILRAGTLRRYRSMQEDGGHPHLKQHGGRTGNAANVPRRMYSDPVPKYSDIEGELFALAVGDLIFGIPNNGELQCFGKNVNFLWPGARSPLSGMGSPDDDGRGTFAAREPERQGLEGSDPAEATFGFAGKHGDGVHPFRGRVRFGTFWGPCVPKDGRPDELQLMPLTAPSGTKAKARPLYLEPSNGLSADYDDTATLRGRKFYWHQRGTDDNIPGVHDLERLGADMPKSWKERIRSQSPPKIRPLPVGRQFTGTLHFTNLTEAELGALLVSIKPDLAYGPEERTASDAADSLAYGIKLGKAKPRGLGSVTAVIELELAAAPRERYVSLDASLATNRTDDANRYVNAYKTWCLEKHKREAPDGEWNDLEMAKAFKALVRIPETPSVRVYPPQFAMYGWLPKENDPDGAPTSPSTRPRAMKAAHDLKGP